MSEALQKRFGLASVFPLVLGAFIAASALTKLSAARQLATPKGLNVVSARGEDNSWGSAKRLNVTMCLSVTKHFGAFTSV